MSPEWPACSKLCTIPMAQNPKTGCGRPCPLSEPLTALGVGAVGAGTAFAITTRPEPSLDGLNLVVGKVVEGMDVVALLAGQRRVKDNSDSPFFQ